MKQDVVTLAVLNLIGLMCDGQRRYMQDYLREQTDNLRVCKSPCLFTYVESDPPSLSL